MQNLIDHTIDDRYHLTQLLGQGKMGAVYLAQDTELNRQVALKVMKEEWTGRPEFRQQFEQEARTLAGLDHPGIVKVYADAAAPAGSEFLYFVMEYLEGETLFQRLSPPSEVSLAEALELTRQLCEAVAYAHQQGVLHGDIKPANIILKPELNGSLPYRPVLTDFGLAQLLQSQPGQLRRIGGTAAYVSPEQAAGGPLSAQSDIYSLGVLLYELVVGRRPFAFKTMAEAASPGQRERFTKPQEARPGLPDAVAQIILTALAVDPARRFTTTTAFREALAAALQSQPVVQSDPDTAPDEPITAVDALASEAVAAVPPQGRVELTISVNRLTVDPGQRVTLTIIVRNLSAQTRHYRIEPAGLDLAWLPDPPPPLRLFRQGLDGYEGQATLTIAPPRSPKSAAGDYELSIRAVSQDDDPISSDQANLTLTVTPFADYRTELWPEVYQAGQEAQLEVHNLGNTPRFFEVEGYDASDEVRFSPPERQVELEPDGKKRVGFKVSPRKRNWFGRPQEYRFSLTTELQPDLTEAVADEVPEIIPPQSRSGLVRSRRLIPPWIALVLLALLCIPLTAFAFLYGREQMPVTITTAVTPSPAPPLPPTATPFPFFEVTASKTAIEEGDCIELSWVAENLAAITVNGEPVTGQKITRCPTETQTFVVEARRVATDTVVLVEAVRVSVRQTTSETVIFSELPDGQAICPGCKLEGKEFMSLGINFSVATEKLPADCVTDRVPFVGIFAADWSTFFVTTKFTHPPKQTIWVCQPAVMATARASKGWNTSMQTDLPSCRMPTATPTRSPLQSCTFAPLKVSFMKPTTVATFTFTTTRPDPSSIQITDAPEDSLTAAAAEPGNTYVVKVRPDRRIKDVIFGLDGQPVRITKIEYRYLK